MQKLLEPQTYRVVVFTIWAVMLPMIAKDVYGFVPSLIAAMLAGLAGMGLGHLTMHKTAPVKWATMLGSFRLIMLVMMVFVKPERATKPAQQPAATE